MRVQGACTGVLHVYLLLSARFPWYWSTPIQLVLPSKHRHDLSSIRLPCQDDAQPQDHQTADQPAAQPDFKDLRSIQILNSYLESYQQVHDWLWIRVYRNGTLLTCCVNGWWNRKWTAFTNGISICIHSDPSLKLPCLNGKSVQKQFAKKALSFYSYNVQARYHKFYITMIGK